MDGTRGQGMWEGARSSKPLPAPPRCLHQSLRSGVSMETTMHTGLIKSLAISNPNLQTPKHRVGTSGSQQACIASLAPTQVHSKRVYYGKQSKTLLSPSHVGNDKGFRSSVPGTGDRDQIPTSDCITMKQGRLTTCPCRGRQGRHGNPTLSPALQGSMGQSWRSSERFKVTLIQHY